MLIKDDKLEIISLLINASVVSATSMSVTDGENELLKIEIKQGCFNENLLSALNIIFKTKVTERTKNYVKVDFLNNCVINTNLLEWIDSIYIYKNNDSIKLIDKIIKSKDSFAIFFNRDVYSYFKVTKIFELSYKNLCKEIRYKMEIDQKMIEFFKNIRLKELEFDEDDAEESKED